MSIVHQPSYLKRLNSRTLCAVVWLFILFVVAFVEFLYFSGSIHGLMRAGASTRRTHPLLRRNHTALSNDIREHRVFGLHRLREAYEEHNKSFDAGSLHRTLRRTAKKFIFRQPKVDLPALTCDPVALPFIPLFTRRSEHVRPRFAVITMIVNVMSHGTSNKNSGAAANATMANSTNSSDHSMKDFSAPLLAIKASAREVLNRMQFVNKMEYCQRHGYDFIVEGQDALDRRRAPQWSKLRVIRKWLPFYDWIMWADEDVLFTNWSHTIEHLVHTRLDEYMLRNLNEQERLAAHNGDPFEYKAPEVDVILTEDWNSWNTGVVFWRNSPWANDFLRRMFRISAYQAAPFHDQGALIFLASGRTRDRNPQAAAADRAHMWVMEDNYFNSYPQNMIQFQQHMPWMWEKGDWAIHFASCKFFLECIAEATYAFREAACENGGHDLPVHLFLKFAPPNASHHLDQQHQHQQQQQQQRLSHVSHSTIELAAIAARKARHRSQILQFLHENGQHATHRIDPSIIDWEPPGHYLPPHSPLATFPPLFEAVPGVQDSYVFTFPPLLPPRRADLVASIMDKDRQARIRRLQSRAADNSAKTALQRKKELQMREYVQQRSGRGILAIQLLTEKPAALIAKEQQQQQREQRRLTDKDDKAQELIAELEAEFRVKQRREAAKHKRDVLEEEEANRQHKQQRPLAAHVAVEHANKSRSDF